MHKLLTVRNFKRNFFILQIGIDMKMGFSFVLLQLRYILTKYTFIATTKPLLLQPQLK